MSDAVATSTTAEELLGAPAPQKKKRPPLPPGYKVQPVHPGATYGVHPVDKLMIRLVDAKALETPGPEPTTPPPAQPPTPPPSPAATPQPSPAPEPEKITPQPEPGPAPDFSDLPPADEAPKPGATGNDQQQQGEPTREEIHTAYAQMAGVCFDGIITFLCLLIGSFWQPMNTDERANVINAIVGYFDSIVAPIITPLQNLWMAIGFYCLPRLPKTVQVIFNWWKSRKQKRRDHQHEKQRSEAERDNAAGTHQEPEPIIDIGEVGRGPGV